MQKALMVRKEQHTLLYDVEPLIQTLSDAFIEMKELGIQKGQVGK